MSKTDIKYITRIEIVPLAPFSLTVDGRLVVDEFYWEGPAYGGSKTVETIVKNKLGQDSIHTDHDERGYPLVETKLLFELLDKDLNTNSIAAELSGIEWRIDMYNNATLYNYEGSGWIHADKFYCLHDGKILKKQTKQAKLDSNK